MATRTIVVECNCGNLIEIDNQLHATATCTCGAVAKHINAAHAKTELRDLAKEVFGLALSYLSEKLIKPQGVRTKRRILLVFIKTEESAEVAVNA